MPNRRTPAVVERCVARVAERLTPLRGPRAGLSGAYAICTAQAQRRGLLAPGSRDLTAEGRRAERRARRRPGLARAERAVSRMAADARRAPPKRNGGAPWLDRDSRWYVAAEEQIHRDDLPAVTALNKADRSGDREKIARAEARMAKLDASRPARIAAYARERYANAVANGEGGVSAEALRASPPAAPGRRGAKRNEWPYGPRSLSARVRGHDVDYDASRGPEAFGVGMNYGRVEVRGHFAPEPGRDPRLPSFVPVAAYDGTYGRPRRALDLRAALEDVDGRLLESIAWEMRERVLSPALCASKGAPGAACPDVRLLTLKGGAAHDNVALRLRDRWPEGVTSARMYVARDYGARDLPLRGRKPNRYTVGRDDGSRSRPFAVYDAGGDVVHRAATRAEAEGLAAEENRVLAEKRAARAAR